MKKSSKHIHTFRAGNVKFILRERNGVVLCLIKKGEEALGTYSAPSAAELVFTVMQEYSEVNDARFN